MQFASANAFTEGAAAAGAFSISRRPSLGGQMLASTDAQTGRCRPSIVDNRLLESRLCTSLAQASSPAPFLAVGLNRHLWPKASIIVA